MDQVPTLKAKCLAGPPVLLKFVADRISQAQQEGDATMDTREQAQAGLARTAAHRSLETWKRSPDYRQALQREIRTLERMPARAAAQDQQLRTMRVAYLEALAAL